MVDVLTGHILAREDREDELIKEILRLRRVLEDIAANADPAVGPPDNVRFIGKWARAALERKIQ